MGILGITNRTENWKTARLFCALSEDKLLNLARRLGKAHGLGLDQVRPNEVKLELFWKGVRDLVHGESKEKQQIRARDFADCYERLFPNLRDRIKEFPGFRLDWKCYHYAPLEDAGKLFSNLRHTEIDIVLETPRHLFIGEAKDKSDFGANSKYVLVHQLIRQYVMAATLLGQKDRVVPFVVGNCTEELKRKGQVEFMLRKCWLKEENILEWKDIEHL